MLRRLFLALGLATFSAGCPEPPPSPAPVTAPPPTPVPAAPSIEPSPAPSASAEAQPDTREQEEAILQIRPLQMLVAEGDPIRLLLHWHGMDGWLDRDHPDGSKEVTWPELEVTFVVEGPDGTKRYVTQPVPDLRPMKLVHAATALFTIRADGTLTVEAPTALHAQPAPAGLEVTWDGTGLASAGTYAIRAEVTVPLGGERRSFHTVDQATVERRSTILPLATIESKARAAVKAHLRKTGRSDSVAELKHAVPTVDDGPGRDRLVRFTVPSPDRSWTNLFFEAVVSPGGKVRQVREQTRFTCVAEGTPIATPRGPLPVERLRVGDPVLGFDPARGERVITHVRARSEPRVAWTIDVNGLAITPDHPVYQAGRWVAAARLDPDVPLRSTEGTTSPQLRPTLQRRRVVDLVVDPPHTYFAGGILVHNKRVSLPPWRFDPWLVFFESAEGEYELVPATR